MTRRRNNIKRKRRRRKRRRRKRKRRRRRRKRRRRRRTIKILDFQLASSSLLLTTSYIQIWICSYTYHCCSSNSILLPS